MNIRSKQDEDKSKENTLDPKLSATDPSNAMDTSKTAPSVNREDEFEAAEEFLKEYFDANIDNDNSDFPMIRETLEKECTYLQSNIDLFKKPHLLYTSNIYFLVANSAGAKMIHQIDKDMDEQWTPQSQKW